MRVPWRLIRTKGIWLCLSTVGIILCCVNIFSTSTFNAQNSLAAKMYVLRNLEPHVNIDIGEVGAIDGGAPHPFESKINDIRSNIERSQSSPIQHIAFLKVHKAASSTAQNLFLRFGWNRNLTFVLSPAHNPFGYPNIISLRESLTNSNILAPPPGKHYDILCNHVFYTKEAFDKFMPKDTAYIGIIREPFELYKSILNYFKPRYIFKKIAGDSPASEFLRDPEKFEPKGRISNSWTRSRMAVEFGFPEHLFYKYNQTLVNMYLEKLDSEFKLVLIAECMEESVVLMRRLLGWSTKDILYLNLNVAHKKDDTKLAKAFDRDFYKRYATLDYALYTFFYKRLKRQIREQGETFDEELLAYKELHKRTQEFCTDTSMARPLEVPATTWSQGFNVTRGDCEDMRRGEIKFVTMIRQRQYGSVDI